MSGFRQVFLGAIVAMVSSFIILGSLMMAFTEDGIRTSISFGPTSTYSPQISLATVRPGEPTPTAGPVVQPKEANTYLPIAAECTFPSEWIAIEVQVGDSLESLAAQHGATVAELMEGNCLYADGLVVGSILRVPLFIAPTPTSTPTEIPTEPPKPTKAPTRCYPPRNWSVYIVKPKDTLYSIGRAYGISWVELKTANCLPTTTIRVGQRLYVPYRPPVVQPTLQATNTSVPPTAPPPASATPVSPTPIPATPTATSIPPTPTNTPTAPVASTDTPVPPSPTSAPPSATPIPPTREPPPPTQETPPPVVLERTSVPPSPTSEPPE